MRRTTTRARARSGSRLAELAEELAHRAQRLRRLARKQLREETKKGLLRDLYNAFKETLIHDQSEEDFSDAFAQTLTYGLLTARWLGNDQLLTADERFTRQTALKHLPATSPFLTDLFRSALSTPQNEHRGGLLGLIDDIANLLGRIDVTHIFGAGDAGSDDATDPIIHFYEPFLAAYDKELKNKRGVFFTPRPVVSHIVRGVHDLLRTELGLEDGLASTDTWGEVAGRIDGLKLPEGVDSNEPFVCILDPATGTGTFLFECIEVIERTMKDRWCRELGADGWSDSRVVERWRRYVPRYLLPRLYGYELMMASYAIAHLKLSFKLGQTGYPVAPDDRALIFLTNTLDAGTPSANPQRANLVATLAAEARTVDEIKRSKAFTVVVGNPPYSLWSQNLSNDARSIVDPYRFVGGQAIKERGALQFEKILQDDYIKFFRVAQARIEETGCGVVGLITNHSFVDNPTLRGMRHSLLASFNPILCVNLHGNSAKKERAPTGEDDANVFDIKQGVAIFLGVHTGVTSSAEPLREPKRLACDLWGSRGSKYELLGRAAPMDLPLRSFAARAPSYLFKSQDETASQEVQSGWKLSDVFSQGSMGIVTARDHIAIAFEDDRLVKIATEFRGSALGDAAVCKKLNIPLKNGWDPGKARAMLRQEKNLRGLVQNIDYRPFDTRRIFYHRSLVWGMSWPTMRHVLGKKNVGLSTTRSLEAGTFCHAFCSRNVIGHHFVSLKEVNYFYPLWLYPDADALTLDPEARPNFTRPFMAALCSALSEEPTEPHGMPRGVSPEDVFAYLYAVLYSPAYRRRYDASLRQDFARVLLTARRPLFDALVKLGAGLVELHLLEAKAPESVPFRYSGGPGHEVKKPVLADGSVWIDKKKKTARFEGVPEGVWSFRVGGYQVCEKWLKDRIGRRLSRADIERYQHILIAVRGTIQRMREIDDAIETHGGWPGAFITKQASA